MVRAVSVMVWARLEVRIMITIEIFWRVTVVHKFVWMLMVFNFVFSMPCVKSEVVVIMVSVSVAKFSMLTMLTMLTVFTMLLFKVFQATMVAPIRSMRSPFMITVSPVFVTMAMMWMIGISNRLALFWSPVDI